jgi:hypothetical protein
MVKEIWKYLHKPRYVDVGQVNEAGETAAQVAVQEGHMDMAALLQGLGVDIDGTDDDEDGSDDV